MTNHLPTWRKSSYSTNTGNCVELATASGHALVRDSKHTETGHIQLTGTELAALIDACTAGDLDHIQ